MRAASGPHGVAGAGLRAAEGESWPRQVMGFEEHTLRDIEIERVKGRGSTRE
jgi:hypothetical protein